MDKIYDDNAHKDVLFSCNNPSVNHELGDASRIASRTGRRVNMSVEEI